MNNKLLAPFIVGAFIMRYESNRDGQRYIVLNLDASHGFLFSLKRAKDVDKWNNHLNFYLAQ